MRLKYYILVILLLFSVRISAQSVDTAWVRTYNGSANSTDSASAIALDDSGNIYVAGSSTGTSTSADYTTIKYLPNGDTAWIRRYNGPGNDKDIASTIIVDYFGNVYISGFSYGSGTYDDYVTIKYYPNGDSAWIRRYNGSANLTDVAEATAIDDSGNVYVTGYSIGSGYFAEYVTIKYDSSGNELWVKSYKGLGITNWAKAITFDDSSNIYVTGYSHGGGTGYDYATIKYYPTGDTAWVRRYNGSGSDNDKAYDIVVDDSSNIYVTGWSVGNEKDRDCATIKYDTDGNELWIERYTGTLGTGSDEAYTITLDNSGNIYVIGYSQGNDTGYDYVIIKYYPYGDTAWVRKYNGPANLTDVAKAITVDSFDNVYVTGVSDSMTSSDYLTIKYDAHGNQVWQKRYNGKGNTNDEPCAIVVDRYGNVFVTGTSLGNDTNYDYVTIKYVQMETSIEEVANKRLISSFNLSQNYPNPFNSQTTISFSIHGKQSTVNGPIRINISIYNILGQKVKTLLDQKRYPGEYRVFWDGKDEKNSDVSSGIYIYKLSIDNLALRKKMVLLK
jgi:hypothetical protein